VLRATRNETDNILATTIDSIAPIICPMHCEHAGLNSKNSRIKFYVQQLCLCSALPHRQPQIERCDDDQERVHNGVTRRFRLGRVIRESVASKDGARVDAGLRMHHESCGAALEK
jgi:hypothetical protein